MNSARALAKFKFRFPLVLPPEGPWGRAGQRTRDAIASPTSHKNSNIGQHETTRDGEHETRILSLLDESLSQTCPKIDLLGPICDTVTSIFTVVAFPVCLSPFERETVRMTYNKKLKREQSKTARSPSLQELAECQPDCDSRFEYLI